MAAPHRFTLPGGAGGAAPEGFGPASEPRAVGGRGCRERFELLL